MKRPAVAFLLSILTIFGGHCYNGRWAKACLFAVLMVVSAGAACRLSFLIEEHFRHIEFVIVLIEMTGRFGLLPWVLGTVVVAVWLWSARTAPVDARREEEPGAGESALVRNLAAGGLGCFGILAWLAAIVVATFAILIRPTEEGAARLGDLNSKPWLRVPYFDTTPPKPGTRFLGSWGGVCGWIRLTNSKHRSNWKRSDRGTGYSRWPAGGRASVGAVPEIRRTIGKGSDGRTGPLFDRRSARRVSIHGI